MGTIRGRVRACALRRAPLCLMRRCRLSLRFFSLDGNGKQNACLLFTFALIMFESKYKNHPRRNFRGHSNRYKPYISYDFLTHAPPVTEGKGMSLLKKMGWNPGEGLGKNKEGSLEPLMLDIKTDKKGLVSEGENSKKGVSSFTKELQGKHPVSALMELCSKRKWKPPLYSCVLDQGPSHRKHFCFKVEVNGVIYQPLNPSANKKIAKADAAVLCLQSLNILPKTT